MIRFLLWLFAGVILGLITHIGTVFLLPKLAPADAPARLRALLPVNEMAVPDKPVAILPLADPAMEMALCRYDIAEGVLKVSVGTTPYYTSASVYDETGLAYGAINDRSASRRRVLDFYVASPEQRRRLNQIDDDQIADTLIIASPGAKGFVAIKALAALPTESAIVREQLQREAHCELVPLESIGER